MADGETWHGNATGVGLRSPRAERPSGVNPCEAETPMKQTRELTRASHMVPEDRELFQPFYRLAQSEKGLSQAALRVLLRVVGTRKGRCCWSPCAALPPRQGCVRQPLFEAHPDSQSPALDGRVRTLYRR